MSILDRFRNRRAQPSQTAQLGQQPETRNAPNKRAESKDVPKLSASDINTALIIENGGKIKGMIFSKDNLPRQVILNPLITAGSSSTNKEMIGVHYIARLDKGDIIEVTVLGVEGLTLPVAEVLEKTRAMKPLAFTSSFIKDGFLVVSPEMSEANKFSVLPASSKKIKKDYSLPFYF